MQSLSVDQLVGQTLGKYRIERLLGQGRLNAVYLAQDLVSLRTDALTLYLVPERFSREVRQRFLSRFLREAAAISTLKHPNILPVFEYGERGGYPYLVTPYMMHGSLADKVKQQGRLAHAEVLSILEQVGAGLEYAHAKGLVHGTLRPSNIVLNHDQTMLVAGFGLMHMLQLSGLEQSDRPYAHLLSIAESFMVAPEYVAPEIVQGETVDVRSDIYALGAILFELLSGQPPFSGPDVLNTALQHVKQPAPLLRTVNPDVPVALASVVNQSLERDPARRFQQIDELVEAFAQVSNGVTGHLARATGDQTSLRSFSMKTTAILPPGAPSADEAPTRTGSWQLLPPIVTGKMSSIPANTSTRQAAPPPQKGNWLNDTPVTGNYSAAKAPGSTQNLPRREAAPPVRLPQPQEAPPVRMQQAQEAPARPANNPPAKEMQPFDWWSMPGQVEERSPLARDSQPMRTTEGRRPAQAPLRLNEEATDWGVQPQKPAPKQAPRPKGKKKSAGMGRRQVVAMLAAGGVLAAGGMVAVKYTHLLGGTPQQAKGPQQTMTNPQPTGKKGTTPATGKNTMTAPPAHTGTVLGNNKMAVNTALDFTNPADGKPGLLVRLPDGTFTAYEKACTHEGVLVHYDPGIHMLVCPAHGAIFDPANGGKVTQGPAQTPIAKVAVRVNADGTVTTG